MIDTKQLNQNLLDYIPPNVCYRHPSSPLVYFPTQKSASSSYRSLFLRLEWTAIDNRDIQWEQDKVFSHIRDPLIRHRKGIVEGVLNYFRETKDIFLKTPETFRFLSSIPIVESHSYTLEKYLTREHAAKVHWIPIDTDLDHVQETLNFLSANGVSLDENTQQWFRFQPPVNVSTSDEIELYNILMSQPTPGEILRYLDFDRCLYAQVLGYYRFEPRQYQRRIKELLSTGLTQQQAESQADNEVESGEYLQWSSKE